MRSLARASIVGAALVGLFVACGNAAAPVDASPSNASPAMPGAPATIPSGAQSPGAGTATDASTPSSSRDAGPSAMTCPPPGTLAPGESTQTLSVGGVTRSFIVHVPPSYTGAAAVPLVFDFHPLQVQATTWKVATGWSGVADKEGFILVWPQGVGDSWNAGRCCDVAHAQAIDDVAFVRAMLSKLSGDACIDPKRVYATGCSNGGGMSYRLACDAADVIAAVAPVDFDCVTGATNSPSCGSCNPSRPISVAQFRSNGDSAVPYGGGPTSVVAGLEFPGAQASFSDWAARNSCTGAAKQDSARPLCSTYESCAGGTETTLCSLPVGAHCANYIPYGIAAVAWDMLAKHALP
jgi:polyhydroxybutyrate depolymerase